MSEVRTEFRAHGIRLIDTGEATLVDPDSDQIVVGVFGRAEEAVAVFRGNYGGKPRPEVKVGDNILFTTRNVVVIFDSTGSDYSAHAVRDALASLR